MSDNPAPALQAAFEAVYRERMQGLPFVNTALRVEAIDFMPWNGFWLGVLVTPWFMNLVLLPDDPSRRPVLRPGEKQSYLFPAGTFEFIAGREASIGDYLACSLFSPMFEFADHEGARLTACAALKELFNADNLETADVPLHPRAPVEPGDDEVVAPLEELRTAVTAPMSRRDFVHARLGASRLETTTQTPPEQA